MVQVEQEKHFYISKKISYFNVFFLMYINYFLIYLNKQYSNLLGKVRLDGHIALAVASSGIAALLLPGGRTAHSCFKIPINIHENSTCSVKHGSELAALLQVTKLIVWDETPMMHRHAFEAVDRTLDKKLFSGKVMV